MANLDRIVNVAISLSTTAIKEQNFSDLLVLAPHSLAVNRVLVVTEAGELLDLGLDSTDPLYIAVRDAFKQIPTVQRVYVGRQQVDTIGFSVTRASDSDYSVSVTWRDADGTVQTAKAVYTGLNDSTPQSIATGLASAITASDAPVSAVATDAKVAVTLSSPGQAVALTLGANLLASASVPTETVTAALNACKRESDDWYGLTVASTDAAVLLEASEWAESNKKLHGVSIDQAGIIDAAITADIASVTQQRQYFRTHVWYHGQARRESLAAAISANRFTFYPGGETWANARLAGISYDALSEGQALAAQAKNANTFEQMRNFAVTQNGKVASGEWIDVIRGRDWLEEQVKINVASALVNANGKVPYTDDGIQVIATAIRQALQLGVTRGLIAPDELDDAGNVIPGFTVTVPRAAAISANDKANRILRDLKFSARLAGAIHVAEIKGNLTYQNA